MSMSLFGKSHHAEEVDTKRTHPKSKHSPILQAATGFLSVKPEKTLSRKDIVYPSLE